jgi:hypothetical protein
MSTIHCTLYSTFPAKFNINPRDYAMSNLVPFKSNINIVLPMQASTFNRLYLRCDWLFIEKSMRLILHICSHLQPKSSRLRYLNTGPSQIQYNYSPCHSALNIQMNVCPLILMICRQFNEHYNPHLLPNTGHNIGFTLCQLWSRSNPIQLHFLIFRHQYSNERIPADIGEMSTIQCALYSTSAATFSLNPRDYAMSNLVPVKSNTITVLPMQASTFNRMYRRCDWWFIEKSMRVILHIFCQIQGTISGSHYANSGLGLIQYKYIS